MLRFYSVTFYLHYVQDIYVACIYIVSKHDAVVHTHTPPAQTKTELACGFKKMSPESRSLYRMARVQINLKNMQKEASELILGDSRRAGFSSEPKHTSRRRIYQ